MFDFLPNTYDFIPKSLSIALFMVFLLFSPQKIKNIYFAVSALFMSAVGDIFLTFNSQGCFLYGLSAFLCAHLFYICTFLTLIKKPFIINLYQKITFGILMMMAMWMLFFLNLYVPRDLKWPTDIYVVVITLMVGSSAMLRPFPSVIFLGALSFALSDTLLSISAFITHYTGDNYLIWLFYYLGQCLIVLSLRVIFYNPSDYLSSIRH